MKNIFIQLSVTLVSLFFLSACGGGDDNRQLSLDSNDIVSGSNFTIDLVPVDDVSDVVEDNEVAEEDSSSDSGFNNDNGGDSPADDSDGGDTPVVETPPADDSDENDTPLVETPPADEDEADETPVVEAPPADDSDENDTPVVENPPVEEEEEVFQCVKKSYYSVKLLDGTDSPATKVQSYSGPLPTDINYNYYSYSGHPIVGPTSTAFEGNFFMTEGSDGVAFNFVYSVDAGGSPDNQVSMDVIISGNDGEDQVLLSDDSAEVKRSVDENGTATYQARLRYWSNTDGGAIGPINNKDFKARVKIYYVGDNKKVGFHSADGQSLPLELAQSTPSLFSEFEVTFAEETEECSQESEAIIARNQCIDGEYQSRKEELTDANYQERFSELIADRRAQVTDLREVHNADIKETIESYNERIAELKDSIKETRSEAKSSLTDLRTEAKRSISETKESYEQRIKELTETYNKDRSQLASELDSNLAAANGYKCSHKKGFFKKLFCKIITFIKKIVAKVLTVIKKFLGVYRGPASANSAQGMKAIKASALKQFSKQHKTTIKEVRHERKETIREQRAEYKAQVQEYKASYSEKIKSLQTEHKELIAEKKRVVKSTRVSYTKERRELADTLLTEARQKRSEWVEINDTIHIEFETAARACFK